MARPATIIDWPLVDRLLKAGANGVQVAARLGIHPDTLYRACDEDHKTGFAAYSAEKRAHGDTLIQEQQMNLAMKGNLAMLIWLGKQRLGQKDKQETEITGGEVEIIIGGKRAAKSED